jgi:hypothetical protein
VSGQGYVNVAPTEAALQQAVATIGPISVAVDAGSTLAITLAWNAYASGESLHIIKCVNLNHFFNSIYFNCFENSCFITITFIVIIDFVIIAQNWQTLIYACLQSLISSYA